MTNLLPKDFNAAEYKELNEDLQHFTDIEAKNHYENEGYKENRKYKYDNIPDDFNVAVYKELNEDLQHFTDIEAKNHYENHGYKKNRKYKYENIPEDFDVAVYKEFYDDLQHLNDIEAKIHYENEGYKEKKKYKYSQIDLNYNVYVYCSGKSGSSTLTNTFLKNGHNTLHVHTAEQYNSKCIESKINPNLFDVIEQSMINNADVYIIDSYRTPIERKISSFFQTYKEDNYSIDYITNEIDKQILFSEEYASINEIFNYFKIPHFTCFDFEKRYNILKHKNVTFIKLRFKDINDWGNILTEIFGKTITIYNDNLSDNKIYANELNIIKKNYKIPDFMIEIIENNKEFKIYNTIEEQQIYLDYWSKRTKKYKYKYKNIPNVFSVTEYKELNEDLKHMSDIEAKLHYENEGYKENINVIYNMNEELPLDFDWKQYLKLNIDLKGLNEFQLKSHYLQHGIKENRSYNLNNLPLDFDWKQYLKLNIDLKDLDEFKLKSHYLQHGIKENRRYKLSTLYLSSNFIENYNWNCKNNIKNISDLSKICICIDDFTLYVIYNETYINKNNITEFVKNKILNIQKNFIENIYIYSDDYNLSNLNEINLFEYNKFGYEIYTNLFLTNFKFMIILDRFILNNIKLLQNINSVLLPGFIYLLNIVNNINVIINDNQQNIIFIDKLKYINENQDRLNKTLTIDYCIEYYRPNLIYNLKNLNNINFELYKLMNTDLHNMDNTELIFHYFTQGKYENRIMAIKNCEHLFYTKQYNFERKVIFKDIFINFPQFHEDELNNKFWGNGWTDWENIKKLKPQYFINDCINEKIPQIGFYDYTKRDVRKYHADLCHKYNIYGFCYYYYYFDGVKALHKPIENMLSDNEPSTHFFLLWANEMWSKRWSTSDYGANILINQEYKKEYWDDNIQNLLKYFKHPKYITINNKPLLGFCVIHDFDNNKNSEMLDYFDIVAKQNGFDGILYVQYLNKFHEKSNKYNENFEILMERQPNYIINYTNFDNIFSNYYIENNKLDTSVHIFDKFNENRYVNFHSDIANAIKNKQLKNGLEHWNIINDFEKETRKNIYRVHRYEEICKNIILTKYYGNKRKLNGFFNGWDNSPRIMCSNEPNNICTKIINSEPGNNYIYLLKILEKIRIENTFDEEFILYNAWNEWGEGNVIEPCAKYGEQRLHSINEAKKQFNNNTLFMNNVTNTDKKIIIIFTHYGGGGTEKFLDIFKNNDTIFPIIIRPSYINSEYFIVSSITQNYKIELTAYKDQPLFNYDYYNFYYYEEINIFYNFLLKLNIHSIFINSLVGFSNLMYETIINLSKQININTYLHDYHFLFNEPQIHFKMLPDKINDDLWFNYKKNILKISNKIICPSYYTKYLYQKYINKININVVYHQQINKSNFNNVKNIVGIKKYKILIYGELSEIKGKCIIQNLLNKCLNFNFVIYGIHDFKTTINCIVHDRYNDIELPNIISTEDPDLIIFSSIFCETFCFALIPALESIYPIVCPNYGSFIELCYGRKNTYHINPYELNETSLFEIIDKFKSNYYSTENIDFLKIDSTITNCSINKLI